MLPKSTSRVTAEALPWYAIRTKSNYEKPVATALTSKGYETFLPEYPVRRESFGRVVTTDAPLFAGYLFCRFEFCSRVPILRTPGLVSIVGFANQAISVPDQEIEAVQALLASGLQIEPCEYLQEGQRVRIKSGPFQNIEGTLVTKKSECKFVVSIALLQRSVAVEIDPTSVVAA